jgi:dTDP-4-amino-4,6-dideoxygalactose transaminase
MRVPFFELGAYHASLRSDAQAAFLRVFDSGRFILGQEVAAFERESAAFLGVEHAVGVSSGTDALVCALGALGVGPGDRVLTTPFTFFATVEAILRVGARPEFCDIDAESFNWSAASLQTQPGAVRAAIAVHLFGRPVPMDAVRAALPGVPVIEDAAQAWGARFRGQRVGGLGEVGCFSLFPSKPLGGFGDGGLVVTSDPALAERCRQIRSHGARQKYLHELPAGGNYRLDELQASLLRLKLRDTSGRRRVRSEIAQYYTEGLSDVGELVVPTQPNSGGHAWAVYCLRVLKRREELVEYLLRRGVETQIYYPYPVHLQPVMSGFGFRVGDFPIAEQAAQEALALPIYPELAPEQQAWVVASIRAFFGREAP